MKYIVTTFPLESLKSVSFLTNFTLFVDSFLDSLSMKTLFDDSLSPSLCL